MKFYLFRVFVDFFVCLLFESGFHVAQANLKLMAMFLSPFLEYYNYRSKPSWLAIIIFSKVYYTRTIVTDLVSLKTALKTQQRD